MSTHVRAPGQAATGRPPDALGAAEVIASGGVATLADLRALRGLTGQGVTEAVLGAALYHAEFTLEQALEVCR